MRPKSLSILSLVLLVGLLTACGDSTTMSAPETFTLRERKVTFAVPPKTWKREEQKEEQDATFGKPQVLAVKFTPPDGKGHLTVVNLGSGELKERAQDLKQIKAVLKKEGCTNEVLTRLYRHVDESGLGTALRFLAEKDINPLRKVLLKAKNAVQARKTDEGVAAIDETIALLEKNLRTEVNDKDFDMFEESVAKRDGKVTEEVETRVDGQLAGWVEFEVGDEAGVQVLFMKDHDLISVSTLVPRQDFETAKKITRQLVDSLKVQ